MGGGHPRELCCGSSHLLSRVWLFASPWTVACKAPLPMGFFFQARILEQVAIAFYRGSSQPRDWTCISSISCIGRRILHHRVTWEAPWAVEGGRSGQITRDPSGGALWWFYSEWERNELLGVTIFFPLAFFFLFVFLPFLLRCNWHTSLYKFRGVHYSDLTSIHQEMIITVSLVNIHHRL